MQMGNALSTNKVSAMARCLSTWNSVGTRDEGAVRVCNVTRPFRGGIGVCIVIPMIGAVGAHARQAARAQASCPPGGPLGQPPSCDAHQGRPIDCDHMMPGSGLHRWPCTHG